MSYPISLKNFRTILALGLATLCYSLVAAADAPHKPNFLFVFTDDQRYDAMGVVQKEQGEKARYPWLKTPSMDRIAAEGIRFRNAFVTLPLCAPSRATFLTGRYNHNNGVVNNHTPFPVDSVTYASLLTKAGYVTGYVGKWHMGSQSGQRPGFTYSASFVGQGRYIDCPFEINGKSIPTHGWVDDVSTSYAVQFLQAYKKQPFALTVGFKTCHGPNNPPARAKDRFAGETVRPVPNLNAKAVYNTNSATALKPNTREANLNYFRTISAADDNLGILLKTLDDLQLTTDTVVIFSSDNGYYHGEHGLGDKRSLYEESLRIPMVLRYPRMIKVPQALDQMVLNLDIAPTLLDLAGVTIPAEMQGKSWVPLMKGSASDWRKSFLAEYFFEARFPSTPTIVGVRTDSAKLVTYPGHDEWTEMFDLNSDPYEMKNLVNDASHTDLRTNLEAELDSLIKSTNYNVPASADKPTTAPASGEKSPKKKKAGKRRQQH